MSERTKGELWAYGALYGALCLRLFEGARPTDPFGMWLLRDASLVLSVAVAVRLLVRSVCASCRPLAPFYAALSNVAAAGVSMVCYRLVPPPW